MVRPALLLGVLAASCLSGDFDPTGLMCREPDHACPEPWQCIAGRCSMGTAGPDAGADAGVDAGADAGPVDAGIPADVNLLVNPHFELFDADGGFTGWRVHSGTLGPFARANDAGQWGARLAGLDGGSRPSLQPIPPIAGTELGQLFCARIHIRHSAPNADAGFKGVLLYIRELFSNGNMNLSATQWPQGTLDLPNDTVFYTVDTKFLMYGGGSVDLLITTDFEDLTPQDVFLLDDLVLVRPSGSTCVFPQ
jgi:hypothetical protein